jgi:hypothetical protein
MTHDELLAKIGYNTSPMKQMDALRAAVELHKPWDIPSMPVPVCKECSWSGITGYPCNTIQAIEKELK